VHVYTTITIHMMTRARVIDIDVMIWSDMCDYSIT
jgi:hypothetical protein